MLDCLTIMDFIDVIYKCKSLLNFNKEGYPGEKRV